MDKNYAVFILGYDLLNKQLTVDNWRECDSAYELCGDIYELFARSDYNNDMAYSDYENLQRFIDDHDLKILKSMIGVC